MIASSHPLPSGGPQPVNGPTAIYLSGFDVEIAADATAAAAPPRRPWPSVGGLFGPVAWGRRRHVCALFLSFSRSPLVRSSRAADDVGCGLGRGRLGVRWYRPLLIRLSDFASV